MLIDLSLSGLPWVRRGSLNLSLRLELRIDALISHGITRSAHKLLRLLRGVSLLDLDPLMVVGITHSSSFVSMELSGMLVFFGTYR